MSKLYSDKYRIEMLESKLSDAEFALHVAEEKNKDLQHHLDMEKKEHRNFKNRYLKEKEKTKGLENTVDALSVELRKSTEETETLKRTNVGLKRVVELINGSIKDCLAGLGISISHDWDSFLFSNALRSVLGSENIKKVVLKDYTVIFIERES